MIISVSLCVLFYSNNKIRVRVAIGGEWSIDDKIVFILGMKSVVDIVRIKELENLK